MSNKSELNLYAQRKRLPTPLYNSAAEGKGFSSTVTVGGKEYRSTEVRSTKKAAEDDAAGAALRELTCVVESSVDSATVKLERLCLERPETSAVETERPEPQGAVQVPFGAVRTTAQTLPGTSIKPLVPSPTSYSLRASHSMDTDLTKKLVEQLNDWCKVRSLPPPKFTISEQSSTFTASITIGGQDIVRTQQTYKSFDDAKLAVTELAISTLIPTPSRSSTLMTPAFFTRTPSPPLPTSPSLVTLPTTPSFSVAPIVLARSPSHSLGLPPPSSLGLPPPSSPGSPPEPTADPAGPSPRDLGPNSKGQLDHYCQKNRIPLPQYTLEYSQDKVGYLASVKVGDKVYYSSVSHMKKKVAESEAAAQALLELEGRGGEDGREERSQGEDRATNTTKGECSASQGRAIPAAPAPLSYKNILQEYAQRDKLATPHYETMLSEDGFRSTVSLTDRSGKSLTFSSDGQQAKKTAEQQAAQRACCELKLV